MNGRSWIPLAVGTALVAAVAAYAITNARHAGVDAPRDEAPAQSAADAWLGSSVTVPEGTELALRLQTTLSTKTTVEGDRFVATVGGPVVINGKVAIPQGASVNGHVTLAEQPGKASGRGRMQLAFDDLAFEGHTYALDARSPVYESKSGRGKDAKLIGGGAIVGGVLGGVVGGTAGSAAKGALVGGATGTAASLLTRGPQLELEAGSTLRVRLDKDVAVRPAKTTA